MIKLSIIIPSFNTKQLLVDCISSIYQETKTDFEVIVVDNASTDGSITEIEKLQKPNLLVIKNAENLGFGKAVNQGLKEAQGEYILLLNSDTVILENAIEKEVKFLDTHEEVGIVGCQLKNSDGSIQPSGGNLPNLFNVFLWMSFLDDLPFLKKVLPAYHVMDNNFYTHQRYLGWVTGAFFLIRKKVFDEIGPFDEKIFMYVEEIDFCIRASKKGFKVAFDPSSSILHKKGASGEVRFAGIEEEFKGLKYLFKKYNNSWESFILNFLIKIGSLARVIIFGIILQDPRARKVYANVIKAF